MEKFKEVNEVLIKWNPLSVIGPALSDEYLGLIPLMLKLNNKNDLENFMIREMSTKYGIEYDDLDSIEKEEFQLALKQIEKILW
ncbi:MAG: hypothetical protein KDC55_12140 [Ignavibacteriae bacterium]|nr:hypothetical protein [Ignavibacteriota bacterium]